MKAYLSGRWCLAQLGRRRGCPLANSGPPPLAICVSCIVLLELITAAPGMEQWDLQSGHSDAVRDIAISADGRIAVTGAEDRRAIAWDCETGRVLRRTDEHASLVLAVAITSDGSHFATGDRRGNITLWRTEGPKPGRLIGKLSSKLSNDRIIYEAIEDLAFHPDGKLLFSCSRNSPFLSWKVNAETPQTVTVASQSNEGQYYSRRLTISPDGKRLAVLARSGDPLRAEVRLIDWKTNEIEHKLAVPGNNRRRLACVRFSFNSRFVMAGDEPSAPNGRQSTAYWWDTESGALAGTHQGNDALGEVGFLADNLSGWAGLSRELWRIEPEGKQVRFTPTNPSRWTTRNYDFFPPAEINPATGRLLVHGHRIKILLE